jgi:predicted nucleotide-binding protein
VAFELGYFAAKLGRGHVCALKESAVGIPSDYSGVEYIAYDAHDGWMLRLANRLRDAGMNVDMNRL